MSEAADAAAGGEKATRASPPRSDEGGPPVEVVEENSPAERMAPTAASEAGAEKLPPVEDLVGQIPSEVRTTLHELFRGRFTRVMRVKPQSPQTS